MDFVKLQRVINKNSQSIFTSLSISGLLLTVFLTGKASFASSKELSDKDYLESLDRMKLVWKNYIPAATSLTATITFICMAQKTGSKKTIAAQTAFAISERAFNEYRKEVIEQVGKKKEEAITDKIAQNKITENPPKTVLITGDGEILCYEAYTGRYFKSDMEKLRKVENLINNKINGHDFATLTDFYYLLNIPQTSISSELGWDSNKLLSLEFSTSISEDGKPCLVFNYNYIKNI